MDYKELSIEVAGRTLKISNGPMQSQAGGYAVVSYGDTVLMGNATVSKHAREGAHFFPMVVDYEENFFATGKIKGSRFVKRGGRPSENATLISRMIDRPMRPLFPKGTRNEVQIITTAFSADGEVNPDVTAITASSMALMLSGAPFDGPVSAVRIGQVDGSFVINPTHEQVEAGKMNLVVAGTMDALNMVEAGMKEVPEETVIEALQLAHEEIKKICQLQLDYAAMFEIEKIEAELAEKNEEAVAAVAAFVTNEMIDGVSGITKKEVKKKIAAIEDNLFEQYAAALEEGTYSKGDLKDALNNAFEGRMRQNILEKELRLDGRGLTDVRPLNVIVDVLPRTHGSAIFQRGETMAVSVATLGGPGDAQIVDTMEHDQTKRYFHHYKFPPYSVGDIRMMRGAGRREIGHGTLAERALEPVLPLEEDFAYTMWVHSEIVACNGSSSMASVCGSTLSLMAAGVPIKAPVAGIAMGLVMNKETGDAKVLTDIQGMEDFAGDMDFKVTGTNDGITALQMDIKVKGLPIDLLRRAMQQAKEGRDVIMASMVAVLPTPREAMSKYAPLIISHKIDPDMIGMVIGKGGETIQMITKECEVEMDIKDDGTICITAPDQEKGTKALEWVKQIVHVPEVGEVFDGKVVKIMEFGAFVQISPGKDGLVHISELAHTRVNKVEDVVKEGDMLKVKLMKIDDKGRLSLSHKVMIDSGGDKPPMRPGSMLPKDGEAPQQGKGGQGPVVDGTSSVRKVNGE